ncbi:hypothetical protein WJX84_001623 [Apatococcus fuscideae]|uniref:Uncharacterized protein n=1 Tax=Apatococcus fuscideae TaxID=2026836 RepID=A0AAW1RRE1_9CHLO
MLLVGLALVVAVSGQPVLLTGRFVPTLGNLDASLLPLVLSWPLTQVTVNFRDSSTVIVHLVDSTYNAPFIFSNLIQYVSFDAAGATSSVVVDGNTASIQLRGLSGAQQAATLTKIDESSQGGPCLISDARLSFPALVAGDLNAGLHMTGWSAAGLTNGRAADFAQRYNMPIQSLYATAPNLEEFYLRANGVDPASVYNFSSYQPQRYILDVTVQAGSFLDLLTIPAALA